MIHTVFCYECKKDVAFEVAGDLSQFLNDTFDCPCDEKEFVVLKSMDSGRCGLFSPSSLIVPQVNQNQAEVVTIARV
jgi:hypothetical protein